MAHLLLDGEAAVGPTTRRKHPGDLASSVLEGQDEEGGGQAACYQSANQRGVVRRT